MMTPNVAAEEWLGRVESYLAKRRNNLAMDVRLVVTG